MSRPHNHKQFLNDAELETLVKWIAAIATPSLLTGAVIAFIMQPTALRNPTVLDTPAALCSQESSLTETTTASIINSTSPTASNVPEPPDTTTTTSPPSTTPPTTTVEQEEEEVIPLTSSSTRPEQQILQLIPAQEPIPQTLSTTPFSVSLESQANSPISGRSITETESPSQSSVPSC